MKNIIKLYGKLIVITTLLAFLFEGYDLVSGNLNNLFIHVNLFRINSIIIIIQVLIVVGKEFTDLLRLLSYQLYIYITKINMKANIETLLRFDYIVRFNNKINRRKLCVCRC